MLCPIAIRARVARGGALSRSLCAIALLIGCAEEAPAPLPPRPEPLAALPTGGAAIESDRFRESVACAQCHTASDTALRDASGRDISPYALWQTSMMSLAARDPFYLAVFQEELARDPDGASAIEAVCTRCHAGAGHEESNRTLGFDALVAGTDTAAQLGRDGVTCTLCHQIDPANLGRETSFSGGFVIGYGREIYGPHQNPHVTPMQMFVDFTPAYSDHVATSELCGTCHTVVVDDIVEQATYLEWRSSSVAITAQCQTCHVPTDDADGVRITGPIAKFPPNLSPRAPLGRHRFAGGNAYMLRLIASAEAWANTGVPAVALDAAAVDAEAHLATAATLELVPAGSAGARVLAVRVVNQTGHKLPTGYPSRRLWLHVTVRAADRVIFESGGHDAGALADDDAITPHRDRISSASQVQVWQAVLVDKEGAPTHRALDAARYGKDDRILPAGFAPSAADRARTQPVGVDGDDDFVAGSDTVTYELGAVPAGSIVEVELMYQSLSPSVVDAIDRGRTPAGTRFSDLARAMPPLPIAITRAQLTFE